MFKDKLGRDIIRDEAGREYIIFGHDRDGYLFRQKTAQDKLEELLYEKKYEV